MSRPFRKRMISAILLFVGYLLINYVNMRSKSGREVNKIIRMARNAPVHKFSTAAFFLMPQRHFQKQKLILQIVKFGKVLHIAIIALAVTVVGCQVMVSSRGMQARAATFFARISSSLTDTRIEASKVRFSYPFGLEVEGVTVFSPERDTLATIGMAMVHFKPAKLLKHRLAVSSVRIVRPDIRLYRDSVGGPSNFDFLLKGKDGNSGSRLDFQANSVIIKNAAFSYDILSEPETPGLFNGSHIRVSGLSAGMSLKTLGKDTLSLALRNLSALEKSGLRVNDGKAVITAGPGNTHVEGLMFRFGDSRLEIPQLEAGAGMSMPMEGIPDFSAVIEADVCGRDLSPVFPKASGFGRCTAGMQLSCRDGVLDADNLTAGVPNAFKANGRVTASLNARPANMVRANVTANTYSGFASWFNRAFGTFGIALPQSLENLERSTVTASASMEGTSARVRLDMDSNLGTLSAGATGLDGHYSASISANGMELGKLLGSNAFGNCSLTASADFDADSTGVRGTAEIGSCSANVMGYSYNGIGATATLDSHKLAAKINYSDNNGSVSINADAILDQQPDILATVDAGRVNLAAYSMGRMDSITVSGRLQARLQGLDIDRATGRISIDDVLCERPDGRSWSMENMTASLSGGDGQSYRALTLNSDFMHSSLLGDYRLSTLGESAAGIIRSVLPLLADNGKTHAVNSKNTDNDMILQAHVSSLDFMNVLFDIPVSINSPADLSVSLNDSRNTVSGKFSAPSLKFRQLDFSGIGLETECTRDSMRTNLYADCVYGDSRHYGLVSEFSSNSSDPNCVKASMVLGDRESGLEVPATVGMRLLSENGAIATRLYLEPTTAKYQGNSCDISMDSLLIAGRTIGIRHLVMDGETQHLAANGVISADSTDVFHLEFSNIDLDGTLAMLNLTGPDIHGLATGRLKLAGILDKPGFEGDLRIGDMLFQGSVLGNLDARFKWNQEQAQVDVEGMATDSLNMARTGVQGFYRPDDSFIDMTIQANHTDLTFLNKWTRSVFSEMGGRTTGRLRLFGPASALDLEGSSVLENAYFNLESIGARFLVKHDVLQFEPGVMTFNNINLFDENGHDGLMDCRLRHDHFHNWRVDLSANVTDMKVFEKLPSDKSSYFATVFAEGDVSMKYHYRSGIDLKVNARTSNGTKFGLKPATDGTESYEFLTIMDRNAPKYDADSLSVPDNTATRQSDYGLKMELNIECDNSAIMDMSLGVISGLMRGEGNVQVKYGSREGLSLNGLYNLSYGQCSLALEDLIKKNFTLREGSFVRFNGPPMETELNILTYHNVNSVPISDLDPTLTSGNNVRARCLMDVTGTASNPELSFDVDIPNGTSQEKDILADATATDEQRNIQFMYLLALGTFYSYDYNSGLADMITPDLMGSILNSAVSGQVDNMLSQLVGSDAISLSSNLSAMSYLSNDPTNLNDRELEGILEAHLLDNRLLINGNFGYRQSAINNTSNFIGDVEVRYLLFPKQGISIKGYNKSNDKYFSKTSLTTQGVGLVFEKDF